MVRKASWTICSPMRARFRGKKGLEVLRISPRGLTKHIICYPIAGKCDFSLLVTLVFLRITYQNVFWHISEAKIFILLVRNVAFEHYRKRTRSCLKVTPKDRILRCYATFNSVISEKSQSRYLYLVTIS